MKFTKSQSYALLAAALVVVTATAHHDRVKSFSPSLAHREYVSPSAKTGFAEMYYFAGPAENPTKVATDFVEERLTSSGYIVKNAYTSDHNGVTHVYLRQVVDGLEVVNGDINVNVDRSGRVISYGNSFYKGHSNPEDRHMSIQDWVRREDAHLLERDRQLTFGKRCRSGVRSENPFKSRSILSPQDALLSLAQFLDIQVGRTEEMDVRTTYSLRSDKSEVVVTNCSFADAGIVPVSEAYIQTEEGTLEPVYDFQVKTVGIVDWFNVQVHAETGKVMRLINYSSHATYNVYPMGATNPLVDKRKLVKETPYAPASPFGWHSQGLNKNFTNTIGNNVYAGDNRKNDSDWEHNPKPSGKVEKDGELVFDFPIDLKQDPSTYVPASTTNVFYWVNKVHDIFYHFGFDEKAGNFQQNNFGRGGEENDAVTAFVEDADDPRLNDAYFTAPPDGEHGILRMQVFTAPHPSRDSSLDISVITHECTHGLNVRLVGGSHNTGCLSGGEANGMNEGWADFFAILLHLNANHNYKSNFEMGVYINYPDTGRGIRNYPYSTSTTTNPETYKSLDNNTYWDSHPKGAVWANMLLEVYQNLLLRLPFTQDWYTKDKTSYANTLIAQLVIDGLKLTSCEPSFLVARDAILQAEKILTGGKYQCDIWKGFSKRGLGPYAQVAGYELETGGRRAACFELPDSCKSHYL